MLHLHRTKTGQFLVRYRAANGKIIASSEPVKRRASAIKNMFAMHDLFRRALGLEPEQDATLQFIDHTGGKALDASTNRL